MAEPPQVRLEVLADPESLARRVADWLLAEASASQGRFAIALSGGSTPRLLFEHLAVPPYLDRFPWARAHWFWGDERFVPEDDPLSNYRMAREALLSKAPIPAVNIHPIPTEHLDPEAAAADYERSLKSFYGAGQLDPARPLFDVTLLGLGTDGHTASLFPRSPALQENGRWVAAVIGEKPEPRITLTFPTLDSSRHVAFLVAGTDKREMLARLRDGDESLPAAQVRPVGTLHIFCDAAAVGHSA
jgi:6-phosphogluconolactonase